MCIALSRYPGGSGDGSRTTPAFGSADGHIATHSWYSICVDSEYSIVEDLRELGGVILADEAVAGHVAVGEGAGDERLQRLHDDRLVERVDQPVAVEVAPAAIAEARENTGWTGGHLRSSEHGAKGTGEARK